ncbi:MAG: hypothetical protein AAGE59_09510 [Cyanobacteria bacterium P01_F01_bin.86]
MHKPVNIAARRENDDNNHVASLQYSHIDSKSHSHIMPSIVFVLSMHRSGSSLLTKGLESCQVNLGSNLMQPGADNKKGFFEDLEMNAINEQILAAQDYQWSLVGSSPKDLSTDENRSFIERIKTFMTTKVKSADSESFLGLKDPRFCRTLPYWITAAKELNMQKKVLFLNRSSLSSAESLRKRNGFSLLGGQTLWLDYSNEALKHLRGERVLLVHLEHFIHAMKTTLQHICHFLGTELDPILAQEYTNAFFEPSMLSNPRGSEDSIWGLEKGLIKLPNCTVMSDIMLTKLTKLGAKDRKSKRFFEGALVQMNWHRQAENESLRARINNLQAQLNQ